MCLGGKGGWGRNEGRKEGKGGGERGAHYNSWPVSYIKTPTI